VELGSFLIVQVVAAADDHLIERNELDDLAFRPSRRFVEQ